MELALSCVERCELPLHCLLDSSLGLRVKLDTLGVISHVVSDCLAALHECHLSLLHGLLRVRLQVDAQVHGLLLLSHGDGRVRHGNALVEETEERDESDTERLDSLCDGTKG